MNKTGVTEIYTNNGAPVVGYVVNVALSPESRKKVLTVQDSLYRRFGDAILPLPLQSIHITLMDWLAPLVDYGKNKDEIFNEIFPEYDTVLRTILNEFSKIEVKFQDIHISSEAIFMKGNDSGEFQTIRDTFLKRITLLPGTKPPSKIIHFTFARFLKEIPIQPIQEFLASQTISLNESVKNFRLIRESSVPMLEYKIIKNYRLG